MTDTTQTAMPSQQTQQTQQLMLTFNLHLDEVNVILQALGRLPFDQVAGMIAKVRSQAEPQVQALQQAGNIPPAV